MTEKEITKKDLEALYSINGLEDVNSFIKDTLKSDAPLLQEIPQYLLSLGGKRIRPILTLLCAKAAGQKELSKELIHIASGIELIHMATILHDDIIDNSSLRRNKVSANVKFGTSNTLLAGDFLLVKAFGLCGLLSDDIVKETESACVALTEGEILETPLYSDNHNIDSYINIAKKKTASLFSLSGYTGARLADCDIEVSNKFKMFGENIGIAFQILDDILDISADQEKLGKPIGTDIRERKPSSVNIFWLESNLKSSDFLRTEPNNNKNEDLIIKELVNEIKDSDVLNSAKLLAQKYANLAKNNLEEALNASNNKDSKSANMLKLLVEYTLSRSI